MRSILDWSMLRTRGGKQFELCTHFSAQHASVFYVYFIFIEIFLFFICSTGAKFIDICKLTDTFEGSIIRVLRRLEELLRQLASASLAIGNAELKLMFEEGASKIRRGVVFAASLYL